MAGSSNCLSSFHPLVREWFLGRYGAPTAVQAAAWPLIASGSHVLAVAPTGSGKTLTAFLEAISRIASGSLPAGALSVLYVSPLKALGEDVRRNLEAPLGELAALFRDRGEAWPNIRAATRSGDTSQAERRRMLREPPSILATTPESLALMLDAASSRAMLSSVRLLVLDEIHVLAGDKRGAMLACQVGRLALLAGEFQRIALSATARPLDALADFVGARRMIEGAEGAKYERRKVAVVAPKADKRIELSVEWPEPGPEAQQSRESSKDSGAAERYRAIVPEMLKKAAATKGLLVFTDSRRRAERLAFLANEAAGEGAAWAHHGSLSKEARRVVEERFKSGELGCVVATASLELGIDIGGVGEVLLAGSPASVASALQRVGRSGHGVGETSRGVLYPFHGMDLVLAAAVARGVADRAVEETRPLSCPLDVLAQLVLELAQEGPRSADALYDIVLSFPPFERLTRELFDSTLAMLAGRYSGTRLRELEPRLVVDEASGTVLAGKGVRALLFSSGGTIPDRGLYSMRVAGSNARIGELDEEFVWERKVGEVFTLGAQAWRIEEIGSEAVTVVPAAPDPDIVPFWKGDARFRSPEISSRALELLDALCDIDEGEGAVLLERDYCFSSAAATACSRFVAAQKSAGAGRPSLPGTRRIVLEVNEESGSKSDSARLVLHTLRGLAINEPLALALSSALEDACGLPVRCIEDDDLILFALPKVQGLDPRLAFEGALAAVAGSGAMAEALRSRLEGSGLFGAQFRANAGRALLVPRGMPGRRVPLWMTRLRAKKLFDAVCGEEGFPIVVETWRSCLGDLFDLEGAKALALDAAEGRVELASFSSRAPSPFAREALWKEIGEYMYKTDELSGRASSSVSDRVVSEALRSARLRPRLDPQLVSDFESRLKRLLPGWGPEDPLALAEWARERVLIPASELPSILAASGPASGAAGGGLAKALEEDPSCGGRLVRITLPGATEEVLAHTASARELAKDPASRLAQWLRREAAVPPARISALFGLRGVELESVLDELVEEGTIVDDLLVAGSDEEAVIDSQNLEILLRRSRGRARPSVEPKDPGELERLVLAAQGAACRARSSPEAVEKALDALTGAALPASLWETEILTARLEGYRSSDLDQLIAARPWQWFGAGKGSIALSRAFDLELFLPRRAGASGSRLLRSSEERSDFWTIRESAGLSSSALARGLWSEAWKGLVASDSFRDLREGIANGFGADLPETSEASSLAAASGAVVPSSQALPPFGVRRKLPAALRERWRGGAPMSGLWYRLDLEEAGESEPDPLDEASLDASRVRTLAARYGLLCRSMLEREAEGSRWGELFPAMRRLELAGELLAGRFFEGVDGPQFLSLPAFEAFLSLGSSPPESAESRAPLWLNALDPAASGLYAVDRKHELLPARLQSNRICLIGGRIAAVSAKSHRELVLLPPPGDPLAAGILEALKAYRLREVRPEPRILVERVNGESASRGPYAGDLREAGFESDRGRMILW